RKVTPTASLSLLGKISTPSGVIAAPPARIGLPLRRSAPPSPRAGYGIGSGTATEKRPAGPLIGLFSGKWVGGKSGGLFADTAVVASSRAIRRMPSSVAITPGTESAFGCSATWMGGLVIGTAIDQVFQTCCN